MRALLKFVSYIVISLLVVVFGVYVQSRSSYNMSIVYAYCFYNIIVTIKNGIDTNANNLLTKWKDSIKITNTKKWKRWWDEYISCAMTERDGNRQLPRRWNILSQRNGKLPRSDPNPVRLTPLSSNELQWQKMLTEQGWNRADITSLL